MTKKKEKHVPAGFDLVDMTPDYSKSAEENKEIWAKRYRAVYGEWPPWMPNGPEEVAQDTTSGA